MSAHDVIPALASLQWPGGLRPAETTTRPVQLSRAKDGSERLIVQSGLAVDWPKHATTKVFVRSPAFETPTECWSWLFQQGVAHHDGRVEKGPDGCWRGSGEMTRG